MKAATAARHDPEALARAAARREVKVATREEMMGIITDIARTSPYGHERIAAVREWLDRTDGKSIARNLNAETDPDKLVINVITKFRPDPD